MPQRPIEAREAVAPAPKAPTEALRGSVRFRAGTPDDVASIVPLINHSYLREAWLLGAPRITEETLHAELADVSSRLIVAEVGGTLAGCVRVRIRDHGAWFGLLAAFEGYQGRGLASLLVAEAERFARQAGAAELRLDCAEELSLPPYYEALGYAVESITPAFSWHPGKGPITRVVMRKALS